MKTNIKKIIPIFLFIFIILFTAACSNTKTPADQSQAVSSGQASTGQAQKVFNATDLAKYDGKNGNPAYIAVDGKVYDVSNVPQWKGGTHHTVYDAGKDYTKEIQNAPHGASILEGIPVVGTYKN